MSIRQARYRARQRSGRRVLMVEADEVGIEELTRSFGMDLEAVLDLLIELDQLVTRNGMSLGGLLISIVQELKTESE